MKRLRFALAGLMGLSLAATVLAQGDADPNQEFAVTPQVGSWMICAACYQGPQAPQLAIAAVPAAPSQGAPKASDSTAIPTWRSQIAAALERNKRYPSQARARREQGVAQLAFTLDRKGHVIASRIVRGSGHAALDQETLPAWTVAVQSPPPPTLSTGSVM